MLLLGYAAFVGWSQQAGALPLTATDMTNDLLLILPLCVALGVAHLMTLEVEARMVELRASYAEPRWLLPFVRTINTLAITLSLMLVGSFATSRRVSSVRGSFATSAQFVFRRSPTIAPAGRTAAE